MILAGRCWTTAVAAIVVVLSTAIDMLILPYDPFRALLAVGVEIGIIWHLVRHRLLLRSPR